MVSCVKEYKMHSFAMEYSKMEGSSNTPDQLTLTTFNTGMLPGWINTAQHLGKSISDFFSPKAEKNEQLLASPEQRAPLIANKLVEKGDDIYCGQEVFDKNSAKNMAKALSKTHSVICNVGVNSTVNSGLFFASRFPIDFQEVRFWRFTNLAAEDDLSDKGVLRTPLLVPTHSGPKWMIVYNTHLQAKLGEKYTKIRQEQAQAILNIVAQDQKFNECPIFVLGDFNITNIESDGSMPNEKKQLASFFDSFYDFYSAEHNEQGDRIKDESWYLQEASKTTLLEPKGSFYNMHDFGTGKELPAVRYDYCLLYSAAKKTNLTNVTAHSELRRWMEPNLSDHLPLTTVVNTQELFSKYQNK